MKYSEQIKRLQKLNACQAAIDYAKKHKSAQEAWDKCARPQDMLWLIGKLSGKPQSKSRLKLIMFLVKNVRKTVLEHTIAGTVLQLAKEYAESHPAVTEAMVSAAAYAAASAAYADYAAYAAASAAYAAYAAAYAAASAAYAAYAAAYAAYAAVSAADSAAYAADSAAYAAEREKWCKLIRQEWPKVPVITTRHIKK